MTEFRKAIFQNDVVVLEFEDDSKIEFDPDKAPTELQKIMRWAVCETLFNMQRLSKETVEKCISPDFKVPTIQDVVDIELAKVLVRASVDLRKLRAS